MTISFNQLTEKFEKKDTTTVSKIPGDKSKDKKDAKLPPTKEKSDSVVKSNVDDTTKDKPVQALDKDGNKIDSNKKAKIDTDPELNEFLSRSIDFADLVELFEGDLSDIDNFPSYIEEVIDAKINDLNEDLDYAQRFKKGQVLRRNKFRISMARKRALRRRASQKVVLKRARREAVNTLKQRFTQRQNVHDMSVAEKNRVERLIKRRKNSVDRLSRKLVRDVRNRETMRLNNSYEFDQPIDALFEAAMTIFND